MSFQQGIAVVILIVAGTWWLTTLNDDIPSQGSHDPLDRYVLQAAEKQLQFIRETRERRVQILTLENMGYGFTRMKARAEALAHVDSEMAYYRAVIADLSEHRERLGALPAPARRIGSE